jgi:8-oxo-dGTP pyrophosphatase MutT (NUDIX family)
VLAALDAAGQAGAVPADVGKDGIFEAPVVGEMPAPPREVNAGVLAVFFEERGEARLILTRRSSGLRTHQGQVSFPGGRLDEGEDAVAAALREAFEEVDLDPCLVTTVGWLHPLVTMVSDSFILPVLGTVDERPHLTPNPGEVDRIFDVSLAELADPAIFHEERWRVPGRVIAGSEDNSFPIWFFEISGELIWGATARMLYELLSIVLVGTAKT